MCLNHHHLAISPLCQFSLGIRPGQRGPHAICGNIVELTLGVWMYDASDIDCADGFKFAPDAYNTSAGDPNVACIFGSILVPVGR
jgi:hypothetical protein